MKKYVLTIIYNARTDEVESVEEIITDMDGSFEIISIGNDDLRNHLTEDQIRDLNSSFTGQVIRA